MRLKNTLPASSSANRLKKVYNILFLITILAVFFNMTIASVEAQTVNKRLYLKTGKLLDRVIPTSGTPQSSGSITKSSAVFVHALTANNSPNGSSASLSTGSFTVAAASNRLIVVTVATSNAFPVTSVTFAGFTCTAAGEKSVTGSYAGLWYYRPTNDNAITGVATANWGTGNTVEAVIGVADFTGVNQTLPVGTAGTATGSGSPYQVSTPSQAGDLIVDVFSQNRNGNAVTYGSSQGTIFIAGTNNVKSGSGYLAATASSTTTAYGSTTGTWTMVGVAIKGVSTTEIFTQTTGMCSAFTIKGTPTPQTITVVAKATVASGTTSGTSPLPLTLILKHGTTTFFTATSATNSGLVGTGTSGTLTWSGTISSDVPVAIGEKISAEFSSDYTPASIQINFDATTAISYIELPTSTYINIGTFQVRDASGGGGSSITQQAIGVPNYIRAIVSDPFWASDITSLDIAITGPSNSSTTLTSGTASGCNVTYEYTWTPTVAGTYTTIIATAHEGTETGGAAVTATSTINNFIIQSPSLTVTKTKTSPVSAPYTLNDNIVYNIAIHNTSLSSLTTLPLQDSYNTSYLQYVSSSITPQNISGGGNNLE